MGEGLLVLELGEVELAAQRAGIVDDEGGLVGDRRDVFEHRLALVRVDAERGDHVDERVGVDVLFVRVTAQDELELGGGNDFADDVDDVIADDTFGGGEIADGHLDDPPVDLADLAGLVAPLFAVLLHRDILGLPMVVLHRLVEIVRPLVLQREDVEEHRLATVDDALVGEGFLGFGLIEDEGFLTYFDGDGFHGWRVGKRA